MAPRELRAWLRLALTPQVGRTTARRLLAALGLPEQVFEASAAALSQLATPAQVAALRAKPEGLDALADRTDEWLAEAPGQRRLVTLAEADYPAALLQIEDPPLMLWLAGARLHRAGGLCWPEAIAVVGSRNPTPQGKLNAHAFARSFAASGWTVVSGLALGVDGAAHEGALEGAGPERLATLAVVGTGLDRVYPRQHLDLAHRIAERGLLISEYPLGTPPLSENFPLRNRLISGLSRGTLVVEAALRSGSLITARIAAEQGREVFAIPGSIHSAQARGCHALLKQGAKLVETAQDVLDELVTGHTPPGPSQPASVPADELDPVLEAAGFDPVSFDALQARTGLPTQTLQAHLLELELSGALARLPGGLFQRLATT
ncbi:DNA-protecting protein DprA [Ramlibacter sp. AW1]|uniref:DNA-protecting protein DprA n=1 Tax=Ramlibacter aurantiacus TaxID=2801330 RepID=A0A936ZGU4_9BURK|nr:DNA-processing protein DprA [Ramlibacter aurantiacus]MBL0421179.1 DNA-protecting protein DprA [Ramlibacter aurantiacus]